MAPPQQGSEGSGRHDDSDILDVVILGAGVSGISAGCHLRRQCPDQDFVILEGRSQLGGTWDLFRYPGIRSDSDMYTFGFPFKPWRAAQRFADGPSIRQYLREAAEEAGLPAKIHLNTRVVAAAWRSAEACWFLTAYRGGKSVSYRCRFLLMCTGYYRYDQGYLPDFPSQEAFAGRWVHPQHWPQDLDYKGKTVAIIGSGATAVTLLPRLAQEAAHVAMIQRSPTYIAAIPARDKLADVIRRLLPEVWAHRLIRNKNVLVTLFWYQLAQAWPKLAKWHLKRDIRAQLGPAYPVDTHFEPRYNPWDQRICAAPDGDFFAAIRSGKARIYTDEIAAINADGLSLASGEQVAADVIVTATGLQLQMMGGVAVTVDGEARSVADSWTYRGMMLSGFPNLFFAFGYTNASWTLKVSLVCQRFCRLLKYMAQHDYQICLPEPQGRASDPEVGQPLKMLASGYFHRGGHLLPRQGPKAPWRNYQNYLRDLLLIRWGRLNDGQVRFQRHRRPSPQASQQVLAPPIAATPDPAN